MKKLFTLALVLMVSVAGFSQMRSVSSKDVTKASMWKADRMQTVTNPNVQSIENMLRGEGDLDYTTYDWQTNSGAINRTIVWPDGKVNFAYTWSSDEDFTDRGTAIGTYDSNTDEWIPLDGRIEDEKTGFGSIARYKENGIIVAAHTATQCGFYIVENKDNMTTNSTPCALRLDPTVDPCWPVVMTSGPNRDIIHIIATGYADNRLYYFRSNDGQTWDKENVVLPFLTEEYSSDFGSNAGYWMETTDDNCLAFVINNAWSDGMVMYSYDNGETWERKVFYHHPGINTNFGETWFMYPRWASCVWGPDMELRVAYEFNGSTGEPGSGSYYPGIGGVAFWSETMPYARDVYATYGYDPTNPNPPIMGQPFIMDSAYIIEDIYASWPFFSDGSHIDDGMLPEYIGYPCPLDDDGNWEDPYTCEEFNLPGNTGSHGTYNSGVCAMPTLCQLPGSPYDLVAVWSGLDENHTDEVGNFYYKLFAAYSGDGGRTWEHQVHLTNDFMHSYRESVYLQATVIGQTLVVACMTDELTGTFVQGDEANAADNYYQGYTFDLKDVFPEANVGVQEAEQNNHISVYPNPAEGQVNVTLNKSAEMTVYNIMGQVVMTMEGRAGVNTIDITSLNSGIYFVSAGNDTQKFIVK